MLSNNSCAGTFILRFTKISHDVSLVYCSCRQSYQFWFGTGRSGSSMLCTSRICTRFPNLPLNVLLQMSQVVLVNMTFSCCVVFSSRSSLGRKYSLLYNLALIEASVRSAILDCVRVQILEMSGPGVSGLLELTGCTGNTTVSDTLSPEIDQSGPLRT